MINICEHTLSHYSEIDLYNWWALGIDEGSDEKKKINGRKL